MTTSSPDQKKRIKTVGVFCSSRLGHDPVYAQHAEEMGRLLGQNGFDLVYGGGASGLMGVVAKAARDHGSRVYGVITPEFKKWAGYTPVDGTIEKIVKTLPMRKSWMMNKADAFVTLFGGIGTLDEKWEVAAHNDMMIAARSTDFLTPIIVLNTNGIYDDEKRLMRKLIAAGAIHPGREEMIRAVNQPQQAIDKLKKWSDEGVMRGIDLATALPESSVHAGPLPKP